MISWASFFTIIGMLCVTYSTRLLVTLFMAARFAMLPTVIVAVATSGILGWLMA